MVNVSNNLGLRKVISNSLKEFDLNLNLVPRWRFQIIIYDFVLFWMNNDGIQVTETNFDSCFVDIVRNSLLIVTKGSDDKS